MYRGFSADGATGKAALFNGPFSVDARDGKLGEEQPHHPQM